MRITRTMSAAVLTIGLTVGACGGGGSETTAGTPTTAGAATSSPDTSGSTGKVSANTATADEIAAALDAAGVPQADRWADEIVEYRPYPADDPDFAHLRDELAKYDPAPELVDQIVAVLEP